jgi:hypothetical protein
MGVILRRILHILDGTPAVYGKRQAGQSMVELALVTPLLIILLAGLVEIGWFANNYMLLLDVTRAGARRATVLTDRESPRAPNWLREFTYVPHSYLTGSDPVTGDDLTEYRMPYISVLDNDARRREHRWEAATAETGACRRTRLFYSEVVCTMITSLEPLRLNQENGIDDIIISGFAVENINGARQPGWLPPMALRPVPADTPQMIVVGRYPAEANECDVTGTGGVYSVTPREPRDPFDVNNNGIVENGAGAATVDGINDYAELPGYDLVATTVSAAEKQVGFSLFGNHKIPDSRCVGSEWRVADIERLMNIPTFNIPVDSNPENILARSLMPGQGVVLAELYWEHTMLLQIPVLSPVFTAVGNANGRMVIYVWAAFPLPSVEPFIVFPQ